MPNSLRLSRHFAQGVLRFIATKPTSVSGSRFMELYTRATDEFRMGNLANSIEINRMALNEADTDSSVAWRDVAAVELNLSHVLKLVNQFEQARKLAESALLKLDTHFSSSKHEVCHALDVLAELCCELQDMETGLGYVNRSIELKSRIRGPSGVSLARSYNIRGALYLNRSMIADARSDYLRALGINVRHLGREQPLALPVGITLSNIGGVLRREEGRVNECVELFREVVDCFEFNLTSEGTSWMLGSALTDLAESLLELRNRSSLDEAKSLLARSLHIFLSTRGTDHPSTARAAVLLRECTKLESESNGNGVLMSSVSNQFVENLINECEKIIPQKEGRISGDIIFLDKRGHVGHGHPHTPLI